MNKRAEETSEKNLETWTELNNKYVESHVKLANMEPAYVSYRAQRQSEIDCVMVG